MNDIARDVTDAEFETAVLQRSREVPVVVDLWAPWCGPCRQLAPLLEKVAQARKGDFELVKINVDENPETAGKLGARSIPLVVAFKDGEVVSQFLGAQPESAIVKFIDELAPSETDRLVSAARTAREGGDADEAERLLNETLQLDPHNRNARLDLAELLATAERYEEALEILGALPSKANDPVARLTAGIRMRMSGSSDIAALEQKLAAEPGNIDAAINLGKALGATSQFDRAMEVLLEAVRKDPGYSDGAARQAVIDLLAVMGPQDPMTREYRQKLAIAIH